MAGVIVFAQEKDRRANRRDVAGEMREKLSLTNDQYERIKGIDESYRSRFHDLRVDSTKAKSDRMKAMRSLGDARRKELEGVLTDEQKTRWEADQVARRENYRAHSHKVADDRAVRIRQELSLSDKQFEKFEKANQHFRTQASELKRKQLSDEERKTGFNKLKKEHDSSMKSILSRQQYKQWTEMKKNQHKRHGKHDGREHRS